MKIALAQQNYHIGNFTNNTQKIIAAIQTAEANGAELIVFSELSICGYPPRDFLDFTDFIAQCKNSIETILPHTQNIGVLVGAPCINPVAEGKDLFNAAYLLYQNKIQGIAHKTLLPTYDVFDEYRYFEPANTWQVLHFKGKKLAITICEDIWNLGDNPLYKICPMDELIKQQPDLMINLSASPFDYNHQESRKNIIQKNVEKYKIPMLYCNTVGSQTEIVFDGGSIATNAQGNIIAEAKYWEEDIIYTNVDFEKNTGSSVVENYIAQNTYQPSLHIDRIHQALIVGIKDYFTKMNFTQAIIGSSGGIDSAVTLALAVEALGAANVHAVLMPSQFSTGHSVSDAVQLSKNLQNPYNIIEIKPLFDAFMQQLAPLYKDSPFGLAEENIQARSRGNVLMSIANKFGYILLNTSNKSELATGYGTLYGDMAGGLAVLGDLYKMQVYALANYINRNGEIIPQHIIDKAPSAELRPNQKDSDSLPDYTVLDEILYQYIEHTQGPAEIKAMGFDAALVDKTLGMVNRNEYKRNQFCPIIRVSRKAFGVGRRLPIVAKYLG